MCIRNTWHAGVFLHFERWSVGIEKCPGFEGSEQCICAWLWAQRECCHIWGVEDYCVFFFFLGARVIAMRVHNTASVTLWPDLSF